MPVGNPVRRADRAVRSVDTEPVTTPRPEFDQYVDARRQAVEHLEAVRSAAAGVKRANVELSAAVATARSSGSSWREIGLAAGMTGRGAQKRWDVSTQ